MDRQQHLDLGTIARTIIDANFYMTLGTADENGRPWVSRTSTGFRPRRRPTRATLWGAPR
jgi:hypothetical protein